MRRVFVLSRARARENCGDGNEIRGAAPEITILLNGCVVVVVGGGTREKYYVREI